MASRKSKEKTQLLLASDEHVVETRRYDPRDDDDVDVDAIVDANVDDVEAGLTIKSVSNSNNNNDDDDDDDDDDGVGGGGGDDDDVEDKKRRKRGKRARAVGAPQETVGSLIGKPAAAVSSSVADAQAHIDALIAVSYEPVRDTQQLFVGLLAFLFCFVLFCFLFFVFFFVFFFVALTRAISAEAGRYFARRRNHRPAVCRTAHGDAQRVCQRPRAVRVCVRLVVLVCLDRQKT